MRIAFVYDAVFPWEKGGAQKCVRELARRLDDDEVKPVVRLCLNALDRTQALLGPIVRWNDRGNQREIVTHL